MSKRWWALAVGAFLIGLALIGTGFWLFEAWGFLENLIVEVVGLAFGIAIVVWLIEGPVLTRQRRLQAILEYKWRVFRITWEIGSLFAREIAQPLATNFDPQMDLYGEERDRWDTFQPLLREVFRRARNIQSYPLLSDSSLLSIEEVKGTFDSCRRMDRHVREVIDKEPQFTSHIFPLDHTLFRILDHVERAERLNLLEDQVSRYEVIGELGDLILDLVDTITPLPEGSRPENPFG